MFEAKYVVQCSLDERFEKATEQNLSKKPLSH